MTNQGFTFYDILLVFFRKWKLFVVLPLVVGLLAFVVASFMPKVYRAEVQILPEYSGQVGGFLGGLLSGIAPISTGEGAFTLPLMITPTDLWNGIVKSNALADSIINRFNFMDYYNLPTRHKARLKYRGNLDTDVTPEGILVISYEDKNPEFAANVANGIADVLDRIVLSVQTSNAHRTREFLSERLAQCESALVSAGEEFARFQQRHKAISLEDQAKAAIENIASLYAQLSATEVELSAMQKVDAKLSPEYAVLNSRASQLRSKINRLIQQGDTLVLGIPLGRYPMLYLEYARLYRDLKVQELLYEYLKQQYEQACIQEQKNVPTLHILSRAEVPDNKYKPKRLLIVAISVFATFFLLLVWALTKAYLEKIRRVDPEAYNELLLATKGRK